MNKGMKTRELILDKAFTLFSEKGYGAVTMKDICGATGLSRGGLYGHFSSTREIFIALLDRDLEENGFTLDGVLQQNVPGKTIFSYFLKQEKEALFSDDKGFFFAVHEFAFIEKEQSAYLDERVRRSADILGSIFRHGQKRGEFRNFDIETMSRHILYLLDGYKTSSSVLTMTEEMIDREIEFIKELIYEDHNI